MPAYLAPPFLVRMPSLFGIFIAQGTKPCALLSECLL